MTISEILQQAHQYFLDNKLEESKAIYEKLLYEQNITGSERTLAEFEYSWILYRQKLFPESIAILSRIGNEKELSDQQRFDALKLLAFSYEALNDWENAKKNMLAADEIKLDDQEKKYLIFELGKVLFIEGSYDKALPYLERAEKAFSDDDHYRLSAGFYKGFIFLFKNEPDKAAEMFAQIIEFADTPELLSSGLFGMAHVYFKTENFENLLKTCRDITGVYPDFDDKETIAYFSVTAYFMLEQWDNFSLFYEQLKYNYPNGKYAETYDIFEEKLNSLKNKINKT